MVEILHTSSLVIDDIADQGQTRRGGKCAHLLHGAPACVNSANYCYFLALQLFTQKVKNFTTTAQQLKIHQVYVETLLKGHVGMGADLNYQQIALTSKNVNFDNYERILMLKTSAVFHLCYRLLVVMLGAKLDARVEKIIGLFALQFQIINDLVSCEESSPKFGDDFVEQKISYPVIYFLKNNSQEKTKLENFEKVFRKAKKEKNDFLEILGFLREGVGLCLGRVESIDREIAELIGDCQGLELLGDFIKFCKEEYFKIKT